MAIVIDERARRAIIRRRVRGKRFDLFLRFERGPVRAGVPHILAVNWAPRHWPDRDLVLLQLGDVELHTERRIARYAQAQDLTISAARIGPFEWLVLTDPFALERMREWERTHPVVLLTLQSGSSDLPAAGLLDKKPVGERDAS